MHGDLFVLCCLLTLSSLHANLGSPHTNGSSHQGHSEGDVNMTTLTTRGERLLGCPADSETAEVRLLSKTISHLQKIETALFPGLPHFFGLCSVQYMEVEERRKNGEGLD